jgi:hypothetical protein
LKVLQRASKCVRIGDCAGLKAERMSGLGDELAQIRLIVDDQQLVG